VADGVDSSCDSPDTILAQYEGYQRLLRGLYKQYIFVPPRPPPKASDCLHLYNDTTDNGLWRIHSVLDL
jgi:hypothetical protein